MRALNGKNSSKADELKQASSNSSGSLELLDLDVTDMASVQSAIGHIESADGRLDVVVNNAGVGSAALLEDFNEDMLKNLFDVNVNGVFRVTQPGLK